MQHLAYPMAEALAPGGIVTIIGLPIAVKDTLIFDLPKNPQEIASVISSSAEALEIQCASRTWTLRPKEGPLKIQLANSMDSTVWVIQP